MCSAHGTQVCADVRTQEHRDAVIDLRFRGRWSGPRRDLRSPSADDLVAIDGNEFVEHAHLGPEIVVLELSQWCPKQHTG